MSDDDLRGLAEDLKKRNSEKGLKKWDKEILKKIKYHRQLKNYHRQWF